MKVPESVEIDSLRRCCEVGNDSILELELIVNPMPSLSAGTKRISCFGGTEQKKRSNNSKINC
jgi:hypothetical protein